MGFFFSSRDDKSLRYQRQANRIARVTLWVTVVGLLVAVITVALTRFDNVNSDTATASETASQDEAVPPGDLVVRSLPWEDTEAPPGQRRVISEELLRDVVKEPKENYMGEPEAICSSDSSNTAVLLSQEVRLEATGADTLRLDHVVARRSPAVEVRESAFVFGCQSEGDTPSLYSSAYLCDQDESPFETIVDEDTYRAEALALTIEPSEVVRLKMLVGRDMHNGIEVVATVRNTPNSKPRDVVLWDAAGLKIERPITVSSADHQVAFYSAGKVLVLDKTEASSLTLTTTAIAAEVSQRGVAFEEYGDLRDDQWWVKREATEGCF